MKQLETQAVKEERERRKKRIISVILLGMLALSSVGYALITFYGYGDSEPKNNGSLGRGQVKIGEDIYDLKYSRDETANVSVEMNLSLSDYASKNVYIDSRQSAISYELASTLGRYSGKMQEACFGECERNLPEKKCDSLLIVVNNNQSLTNDVKQNDNCIFINGDLKAVDAFIYRIFDGI